MGLTGLLWIDPTLSLIIVAVILIGTWGLLRHSVNLALDAVPHGIDPAAVRDWLAAQPGVTGVHDLHIWAMSTTENAMTAHVTRADHEGTDAFLHTACEILAQRFNIGHATLQVETGDAEACRLAPAGAV
jgi:cobalt-zinc-cadmium efflux system protein